MTIFIDIPPVKIDVLELLRRIDKSDQKTLLRAILGGEGKLTAWDIRLIVDAHIINDRAEHRTA